ncbi:hypothetical protein QVD17_30999 [Tagetes erecta]|uniref:Uncharacterized protein n=1 Tax=Tagetes erecta TaxID=13708 RepID=A0AAD8K8X9_TARER|nr:hypothetical protein QVD17_30999 [Tagetes erecta]
MPKTIYITYDEVSIVTGNAISTFNSACFLISISPFHLQHSNPTYKVKWDDGLHIIIFFYFSLKSCNALAHSSFLAN